MRASFNPSPLIGSVESSAISRHSAEEPRAPTSTIEMNGSASNVTRDKLLAENSISDILEYKDFARISLEL